MIRLGTFTIPRAVGSMGECMFRVFLQGEAVSYEYVGFWDDLNLAALKVMQKSFPEIKEQGWSTRQEVMVAACEVLQTNLRLLYSRKGNHTRVKKTLLKLVQDPCAKVSSYGSITSASAEFTLLKLGMGKFVLVLRSDPLFEALYRYTAMMLIDEMGITYKEQSSSVVHSMKFYSQYYI